MKTALTLVLLLLIAPVHAGPIGYFETVNGDLAGGPNYTQDLPIHAGLNLVGGEWSSTDDFDSFRFTVGFDTVVDRITLLLIAPLHAVEWMTAFRIGDVYAEVYNSNRVATLFDALMPLRTGSYWMNHAYTSGNAGEMGSHYLWMIMASTVATSASLFSASAPVSVPEPASWLMMVGALALFGLRRRMRP